MHILVLFDSVAQLGERHLDRVEVAGSSPVGIIGAKPKLETVGTRFLTTRDPIQPDAEGSLFLYIEVTNHCKLI